MIIALDARPLVTRQIGGIEQHARNVIAQWARIGVPHQFLLLCDRRQRDVELYDYGFVHGLGERFKVLLVPGYHMEPKWYAGSRMLSGLSRTISRSGANVYHSFTPIVPQTSLCPVVQTVHDLSYELDPAVRRLPESRRHRRLTRMGVDYSTRIIAVSSQTKNDIASVYHVDPKKIDVVYNGINPVFTPEPDPVTRAAMRAKYALSRPYVLAVGSDIPRRNYARILAAMQIVWKAGHKINWVVAGRNDWLKTPLFKKATEAGVIDRMVFVTAPNDLELAQLYRDAVMAVCGSSFEGFGLSVLESMSCGTPVACSDMTSLREVADESVVYFPHDDAEVMGQSIAGLIDDVEYRRQLRYRGLTRGQRFTWERASQMILAILERMAKEK